MQPTVIVNNQQSAIDVSIDIPNVTLAIIRHLNLTIDHMEITLLSKSAMIQLNQDHFDLAMPTDTISINLGDDTTITGDIYLCPDVIGLNAKKYTQPFDKEFYLVLIHSILHLAGHQDDTPEHYRQMTEYQERILHDLNL